MDPSEILNDQFHIGGQFIHIGPNLDYIGGEEGMSKIERGNLSLQEVKGHLRDHIQLKESMKLYFLLPRKELISGLVFLHDDIGCVEMADYICVGGVADVYVEYHGEEDSNDSRSGSDFEDEIMERSDDEPDVVITVVEHVESDTDVLITDESGVITQRICSPMKQTIGSARQVDVDHEMTVIEGVFSQVLNPTQGASASASKPQASGHVNDQMVIAAHVENGKENSDSESDTEYIGHTDGNGEDSEVV
ncbi:hypothetical protein CFC21_024734 [Triticum aestivum]|uniref:Uncharacterized protein n=2 Tax=Triticum aestivum TaxID=4565 RepID=A0A3B6CCZ8_WHEAT|nr:hypothetical protein CFC21_024734 [Triticum aestivum]